MYGLWVVFEGPDGVGKSTIMAAVANELRQRWRDVEVIETRHPGSTELGRHIRGLVKHPDKYGVTIDPLSSQMMMFVDHINFKNTILQPALDRGAIILADRCDLISGLVYGRTTGLSITEINMLVKLACKPMIDSLYLLECSAENQEKRLRDRVVTDRFEDKSLRKSINDAYRNLIVGSAEKIIMINNIVALEKVKFINTDADVETIASTLAIEIQKDYIDNLNR